MSLHADMEEILDLPAGSAQMALRTSMNEPGQKNVLIVAASQKNQMKVTDLKHQQQITQQQQKHPLLPMIKTQRPKLGNIPKVVRLRPITCTDTNPQNNMTAAARRFSSAGDGARLLKATLIPTGTPNQDHGDVRPRSGRLTGYGLIHRSQVKALPGQKSHVIISGYRNPVTLPAQSLEFMTPDQKHVQTLVVATPAVHDVHPPAAGAPAARPGSPNTCNPRRQPTIRKPLTKFPAADGSCLQLIKKDKAKKLEPVSSGTIRNRIPAIMPAPSHVSQDGRRTNALTNNTFSHNLNGMPAKTSSGNEPTTRASLKQLSPIVRHAGDMSLVNKLRSSKNGGSVRPIKFSARSDDPRNVQVADAVAVVPVVSSAYRRPSAPAMSPRDNMDSSQKFQRLPTAEQGRKERQPLVMRSSPANSPRQAGAAVSGSELRLGQPWGAWQPAISLANELPQKRHHKMMEVVLPSLPSQRARSTGDSGYENDQDIESIDCKVPEPEELPSSPVLSRFPAEQYTRVKLEKQLRVLNWLTECTEDANPLYFPPAEPKPIESVVVVNQNIRTEETVGSPLGSNPALPTATELEFV